MKLTQIARKTIEERFEGKDFEPDENTKEKYKEKRACFVTLTKQGNLRGCIGSLEPRQELWKEIIENSVNSAFHDPRFFPLKKEELKAIKIEVSVLNKPKILEYENEKDLLEKINEKMGLILKKGFCSATFLPQVWEELSNKREFLEHLSIKAGLSRDGWKNAEFLYYNVKKFEE